MPVAYMPNLKKITLLQLDGELNPNEFNNCLDEAVRGCLKVYEIQRSSLMEKYFGDEKGMKE
ncbi:MAG TPA: exosome complex exonuclease Rrp41, partial [Nitrososphaeraceae archaeon]